MDYETLSELKALNVWKPFTTDVTHQMLGEITSLLSHQVYKKGYSATDRWSFLKPEIPTFLEDGRVIKAKRLITSLMDMPELIQKENRANFVSAIKEEIEIEKSLDEPDLYVIRELSKLL